MVSLRIVIVNWNGGQQLRQCLRSIVTTRPDGFTLERVVVVDNASADGSAENLADLALPLTVIRNGENRGFGAACNQGAAGSAAPYLLFLNPDTRLFRDSLAAPIRLMQRPENQQIGVVGIQLTDERGDVHRCCARFPSPGLLLSRMLGLDRLFPRRFPGHYLTDWDHRTSRDVDQVMGAFFLVRRSLFEAQHGFDERFFVYMEDLDFSLRIREAGWRSFYFAGAQAYHKGRGTTDQAKSVRLSYSRHSRILYCYKHFGRWRGTCLAAGFLLLEPVSRVALAAARGSRTQVRETLNGYALLWRALLRRRPVRR